LLHGKRCVKFLMSATAHVEEHAAEELLEGLVSSLALSGHLDAQGVGGVDCLHNGVGSANGAATVGEGHGKGLLLLWGSHFRCRAVICI
jgi:hypothetical protein